MKYPGWDNQVGIFQLFPEDIRARIILALISSILLGWSRLHGYIKCTTSAFDKEQ
jgi:hypothetical protein